MSPKPSLAPLPFDFAGAGFGAAFAAFFAGLAALATVGAFRGAGMARDVHPLGQRFEHQAVASGGDELRRPVANPSLRVGPRRGDLLGRAAIDASVE